MFGNIRRANRQNGGNQLDVEGWFVWEPGDPANVTITATIAQNGGTSSPGTTQTLNKQNNPATPANPGTWRATVNANGTPFVQGRGSGTALPSNGGGWTADPLIVD